MLTRDYESPIPSAIHLLRADLAEHLAASELSNDFENHLEFRFRQILDQGQLLTLRQQLIADQHFAHMIALPLLLGVLRVLDRGRKPLPNPATAKGRSRPTASQAPDPELYPGDHPLTAEQFEALANERGKQKGHLQAGTYLRLAWPESFKEALTEENEIRQQRREGKTEGHG